MSAENVPQVEPNLPAKIEESVSGELSLEQEQALEAKLASEQAQWLESKQASEIIDNEKLENIKGKLGILPDPVSIEEIKLEPIPLNKSLVPSQSRVVEEYIPYLDYVIIPNEETTVVRTGNYESEHNRTERHSENNESNRNAEVSNDKTAQEEVIQAAIIPKTEAKTEHKEKRAKTLHNIGVTAGIGVGGVVGAGLLAWTAYGVAANLAAQPVFAGAAGLAGFTGFAALIGAAVGAWFGIIAIDEFFKAGGFKALFASATGGSHSVPKKTGGGGGAHH